jgi:hypothetical protein
VFLGAGIAGILLSERWPLPVQSRPFDCDSTGQSRLQDRHHKVEIGCSAGGNGPLGIEAVRSENQRHELGHAVHAVGKVWEWICSDPGQGNIQFCDHRMISIKSEIGIEVLPEQQLGARAVTL